MALTEHRKSIIFRREYPQLREIIERSIDVVGNRGRWNGQSSIWRLNDGRVVELSAAQHEKDKAKFQGRAHDFVAFDELPGFTLSQYRFLIGWCRSPVQGQRCRVVATGNPPMTADQRWVIEEWAPWLDKQYHDLAAPGELRWYTTDGERTVWLPGPEPFLRDKDLIRPRSRTFIPASLDDNPALANTTYRSVLQAMPEPLRSMLLYGDFLAGVEDDPWQIIPTSWVEAAMERWRPDGGKGRLLSAVGVDPARGGRDCTALAKRYRTWFAKIEKHPGSKTPDGQALAGVVKRSLADLSCASCQVNIDVIGIGAAAYDFCREWRVGGQVNAINFGAGIEARDSSGQLEFANVRAYAYWSLREALDPGVPECDQLALPPDKELLADLTAAHWMIRARGIQVEAKEDIKIRIGRSPDAGDALVLAHFQQPHAGLMTAIPNLPPPPAHEIMRPVDPPPTPPGGMAVQDMPPAAPGGMSDDGGWRRAFGG